MTTPHKATPEQWDRMEGWRGNGDAFADCTLELRDRIKALEAAANSKPTPNHRQIRSSHPSHLVERVSAAIEQSSGHGEAIAAISVIAKWLETLSPRTGPRASRWLLNEVKRRG
jgi:hypothetical protein